MSRVLLGLIAFLTIAVLSLWGVNSNMSASLAVAEHDLKTERAIHAQTLQALAVYRETHARDTKRLTSLDRKIKDLERYVSDLPDGGAQCLSPADTERLRDLWQ